MITTAHVKSGKSTYTATTESPRQMVSDLIRDNPKTIRTASGRKKAQLEYRRSILADPDLNDTVIDFSFDFFLGSLLSLMERASHGATKSSTSSPASTKRRTAAEMRADAEKVAEEEGEKAFDTLLNLPMPNGKKLQECTFGELAKFGARFIALSKMGKPREIIGKKLDEATIRTTLLGR